MSTIAKDWLTAFVFIVLFFGYFEHLQPFQREFRLDDLTLQYPFARVERVTDAELYVYCALVPTAVICLVQLMRMRLASLNSRNDNLLLSETNRTLLGLWVSVVATACVTDVLKVWIARPRPDFVARCGALAEIPLHKFVTTKVCTAPLGQIYLMDGMKSTPLGHLSMSFAGLFYLTLWLGREGKLPGINAIQTLVVRTIPSLLATYIALSRTQDYRHHFFDVLLGLAIGIAFAWGVYSRYHQSHS